MNRQDQFERVYAELTGREVEAIKAMRFRITEGYASPKIADAYRVFCASRAHELLESLEGLMAEAHGSSKPLHPNSLYSMLSRTAIAAAKGVAQ